MNIKESNQTPIIRFGASPVSGSIIGNAGSFPIARDQTDYQFVYNLSTVFGNNHNFKAGTDIRLSALDDLAESFGRGFWSFSASCGGVVYPTAYAAFWDGCVTSYTKAYGPFYLENRINEYNFYVEDNWRVTPELTLNLGLRYEYAGAARDTEDRVDYVYQDDTNNVEPRVGFAWVPRWQDGVLGAIAGEPGAFVIRGGYGLYDGRIFQSVFSQTGASLRTNPPDAISLGFTTLPNITSLADPTMGYVVYPRPGQTARRGDAREPRPRDAADPPVEPLGRAQGVLELDAAPHLRPWAAIVALRAWNLAVTPAEGGACGRRPPEQRARRGVP
jgi:outer membrane receptor protein involved in Fe transport